MSNAKIRAELETRLKTWADAQSPKIPIAFQNVAFTKPADGSPYMEPILMPNATINRTVDGKRKTYIGLFQVNCWAQSGNGMGTVEALAQSVVNLFPILPKTGAVSIEKTPEAEHPLMDDTGWVIVPVTIQYRMETF
jgi:hypothetical protein